ncbi:hypothetical protein SAMN05444064_12635 [Pseudomonas syringae]|uniref:hypothetical protein n=1 Tax=Pseudomonas syringae TaxID=317 RepID=UPI0008980B8C|nr:hypothetical protein [Pseudomonas syringae]SDX27204.1 hypothetical protein SAMN05444514_11675 [Pseudomonas syringae]SFM69453.1 hypothetical protein SAMN05444064_12635 [Pseudomonas syringae]
MNNTPIYSGAEPEVSKGLGSTTSGINNEKNQSRKEMIMLIESEIENTLKRLEAFRLELRAVAATEMEENAFQQNRQLEQLNSVVSENRILLEKLHETQEAYETLLQREESNVEKIMSQSTRLAKVLEKNPAHWEVEQVKIERLPDIGSREVVQWHIHNAYLGDELVSFINLKTHVFNDRLELFIQRADKNSTDWIDWPLNLSSEESFPCVPDHGQTHQGVALLLSSLGTRDWQKLKILIKRMADALSGESEISIPDTVNAADLKEGLTKLSVTYDHWPLALRYDSVTLAKTIQTEHYRSLSILLKNVSLGERRWNELEYNLATVDENGGFGQNPRLEFPESARDVIDNWFVESEDGRGLRLELRFARPQAIDTNVWRLLSDSDQILIVALVSNLPAQLEKLQSSVAGQSLQWKDWQALAHAIRVIMVNNMRPLRKSGT